MANQVGSGFYRFDTVTGAVIAGAVHVNAIQIYTGTAGTTTVLSGANTVFTTAITGSILHMTFADPQILKDGITVSSLGTGATVTVFIT